MRSRRVVAALCLAMLAVPAASAAWPQASQGGDRTSHIDAAGPSKNVTAFVTQMPGVPSGGFLGPPQPLIVDDHVYLPVEPGSGEDDLDARGIARVNLETGATELFIEMTRTPQTIATADNRIYVTRDRGMNAYDLATGEEIWTRDHPDQVVEHEASLCQSPAVADGRVYTVCTQFDGASRNDTAEDVTGTAPPSRPVPFAWSLSASTGEDRQAVQLVPAQYSNEGQSTIDDPESGVSETRASPFRFAGGISVVGSTAYALTGQEVSGGSDVPESSASAYTSSFHVRLWALDAEALPSVKWTNRTEPIRSSSVYTEQTGRVYAVEDAQRPIATHVTGTGRVVYTKLDGAVQARSSTDGDVIWEEALGEADVEANVGGMNSGFDGSAYYAASAQTLYRFDTDVRVNTWQFGLNPELDEEFGWGSVMVAADRIYAMAQEFCCPAHSALYAVDADTGDLVFRHQMGLTSEGYRSSSFGPFASHALGDGVVVAAGTDGTLHVIGETDASLEPEVDVATDYPSPGEIVTVDLSGTDPGAFGDATRYKAIWGDGNTTGWQPDPVLNHTYVDAGNVTARFLVGNHANQTNSTTHTFHVGQEPPSEPNLIEEAFQRENQDMTFGILGLAVALGGGAIGVARRKRKQSTLQDELETLEEGFDRTKDNPGECEAFLDTRKARAQSLLLDGNLDEEQFGVLERRIDELHGELRTSVLDARFEFLPHGMVQSLKKMLADGRISTWEHDAIADLLDREEALSEAQKEKVRSQLDRWFAEDAGGAEP